MSWCAEVALWAFGTGLRLAATDIPVRSPSYPRWDANRTQRSHYVDRQAGARRVSSLQCLERGVAIDRAILAGDCAHPRVQISPLRVYSLISATTR
jgi:hypothetical protein